jgi:hypothetical protein
MHATLPWLGTTSTSTSVCALLLVSCSGRSGDFQAIHIPLMTFLASSAAYSFWGSARWILDHLESRKSEAFALSNFSQSVSWTSFLSDAVPFWTMSCFLAELPRLTFLIAISHFHAAGEIFANLFLSPNTHTPTNEMLGSLRRGKAYC